jgi:DNA replication ATP-dependent helicase Dna2
MTLANKLVYNDALRCGNDHVAKRAMHLPRFPHALVIQDQQLSSPKNNNSSSSSTSTTPVSSLWLTHTVDPSTHVVFLDTQAGPGSHEGRVGSGTAGNTDSSPSMSDDSKEEHDDDRNTGGLVVNEFEARVVRRIVDGLVACGANPGDIGVISPYRSQLKLLRRGLHRYKVSHGRH